MLPDQSSRENYWLWLEEPEDKFIIITVNSSYRNPCIAQFV